MSPTQLNQLLGDGCFYDTHPASIAASFSSRGVAATGANNNNAANNIIIEARKSCLNDDHDGETSSSSSPHLPGSLTSDLCGVLFEGSDVVSLSSADASCLLPNAFSSSNEDDLSAALILPTTSTATADAASEESLDSEGVSLGGRQSEGSLVANDDLDVFDTRNRQAEEEGDREKEEEEMVELGPWLANHLPSTTSLCQICGLETEDLLSHVQTHPRCQQQQQQPQQRALAMPLPSPNRQTRDHHQHTHQSHRPLKNPNALLPFNFIPEQNAIHFIQAVDSSSTLSSLVENQSNNNNNIIIISNNVTTCLPQQPLCNKSNAQTAHDDPNIEIESSFPMVASTTTTNAGMFPHLNLHHRPDDNSSTSSFSAANHNNNNNNAVGFLRGNKNAEIAATEKPCANNGQQRPLSLAQSIADSLERSIALSMSSASTDMSTSARSPFGESWSGTISSSSSSSAPPDDAFPPTTSSLTLMTKLKEAAPLESSSTAGHTPLPPAVHSSTVHHHASGAGGVAEAAAAATPSSINVDCDTAAVVGVGGGGDVVDATLAGVVNRIYQDGIVGCTTMTNLPVAIDAGHQQASLSSRLSPYFAPYGAASPQPPPSSIGDGAGGNVSQRQDLADDDSFSQTHFLREAPTMSLAADVDAVVARDLPAEAERGGVQRRQRQPVFPCPVCLVQYTEPELVLHMAVHPVCEVCQLRFTSDTHLRNHLDSDHVKCYDCGEFYLDSKKVSAKNSRKKYKITHSCKFSNKISSKTSTVSSQRYTSDQKHPHNIVTATSGKSNISTSGVPATEDLVSSTVSGNAKSDGRIGNGADERADLGSKSEQNAAFNTDAAAGAESQPKCRNASTSNASSCAVASTTTTTMTAAKTIPMTTTTTTTTTSTTSQTVNENLNNVSTSKPVNCLFCTESFSSSIQFQFHMKENHKTCPKCTMVFHDKASVGTHDCNPVTCRICMMVVQKNDLPKHEQRHPMCFFCQKRFQTEKLRQAHLSSTHVSCHVCKIYQKDKASLLEHYKVCSLVPCPICARLTPREGFEDHYRKHPCCEFCQQVLSSHKVLADHISDVHATCAQCKQHFANEEIKNKHAKTCRFEPCLICDKIIEMDKMDRHLSSHPSCDLCHLTFTSTKMMKCHKREEHANN